MKKCNYLLTALFFLSGLVLLNAQPIIINHTSAFLDPIPESAIIQAHENLHIAYGHTSHGSQLTEGMYALDGQNDLFGYMGDIYCVEYYYDDDPNGNPCLDLHDYFKDGDLGHNGDTQWADKTRDYLDNDPYSGDINVIMWSWCGGCSDNTYEGIETYLNTMNQLETDYPDVHFVYMTGHVDIWSDATLKANNQHIRDYCIANDKILYDFADIERYDPDDNYFEFVNDDCTYYDADNNVLGNWAMEWQNTHTEGIDWYDCPAAHTYPLNGNRKAYAAWWMFARIAGWDGPVTSISAEQKEDFALSISPNPSSDFTVIRYKIFEKSIVSLKIFDIYGNCIEKITDAEQKEGDYEFNIDLSTNPKGFYTCVLNVNDKKIVKKIVAF